MKKSIIKTIITIIFVSNLGVLLGDIGTSPGIEQTPRFYMIRRPQEVRITNQAPAVTVVPVVVNPQSTFAPNILIPQLPPQLPEVVIKQVTPEKPKNNDYIYRAGIGH